MKTAPESAAPDRGCEAQAQRIYCDLLDDPAIQRLPARKFKRKFIAAIRGEVNEFSPYIAIDRGRLAGRIWAAIRRRIFARDGYTCRYCGAQGGLLECDHVVPIAQGGSDEDGNLVTACRTCNRSKRARTPEQWLEVRV